MTTEAELMKWYGVKTPQEAKRMQYTHGMATPEEAALVDNLLQNPEQLKQAAENIRIRQAAQ